MSRIFSLVLARHVKFLPSGRQTWFVQNAFQQVRFHQWNVVTRRVEADKNVLLQVRDESSFHGLMLLVFRFEVIENSLEFSFKISKTASTIVSWCCILSWTPRCGQVFRKHFCCSKVGTLEQTETEQVAWRAIQTDSSPASGKSLLSKWLL